MEVGIGDKYTSRHEVHSSFHRQPIIMVSLQRALPKFLFESILNRKMYRIQFLIWRPLLICAIFFHFFGVEFASTIQPRNLGERRTWHVTFLFCNLGLFFQYQSNCISYKAWITLLSGSLLLNIWMKSQKSKRFSFDGSLWFGSVF